MEKPGRPLLPSRLRRPRCDALRRPREWKVPRASHRPPWQPRTPTWHLGQQFLQVAAQRSKHPALITEQGTVTYGDLAHAARRFSRLLRDIPGWQSGDRVILNVPNSAAYLVGFYGSLLAGGVVVPVPVDQTSAWFDRVIAATQPRAIVTRHQLDARQLDDSLRITDVDGPVELTSPASLAAIFWTSGSTGVPKGVMLSHRNFLENAASIRETLQIRAADRALAILPFCFAFGNSVVQSHLLAGATLVLAGSVAFPATLFEAMQRYDITSYSGVPDVFLMLLRCLPCEGISLPHLRYAAVAGGELKADLAAQVVEALSPARLYLMYGQTEATARLSILSPDELARRPGSIGRGLPGVTLEVVDEDGRQVLPGEVGLIRAAGRNIMLGYWQDTETTQQILRDGWLSTGDQATVDSDGYIYPRGRANLLIKVHGVRVHPLDIEDAVAKELSGCDVIVVPFRKVDGTTGLAMFVAPGRCEPSMDVARVRSLCQRLLSRHHRPDRIEILNEVPLTAALKVDRAALVVRAENSVVGFSTTETTP